MTLADQLEPYTIHPATRLGHVHLTVADLDRQLSFYQAVLGLQVHWRDAGQAGLGAGGEDLLRLTEAPSARRIRGTTGLYHFALEFPTRRDLARAIARLLALRYPNAPTDHILSKTTYLDDPEGQNIELLVQTPDDGAYIVTNGTLEVRRADGTPADPRSPLDLEALFRELDPADRLQDPAPAELKLGHIHLYASDLDASMHFYHDVLGFQRLSLIPSFQMADVSVNGRQIHTIAFNTWMGAGAPPPPPNALGIRCYTIVLPGQAELDQLLARVAASGLASELTPEGYLVRDPAQVGVVLTAPPAA